MNISRMLRDTAARLPDKVALIEAPIQGPGRTVTYSEFDRRADNVAATLREAGHQPGDRVLLAFSNVAEFPFAYFGVLRAGGVVVPLNGMLTSEETAKVIADCSPSFALAGGDLATVVEEAVSALGSGPQIITPDRWSDGEDSSDHEAEDDDVAVLAYTSGTTGEAKGAMLTHGNLRANLEQQMAIPTDTVTEDDVLFLTLPLFHIFGLNVPLGLLVLNGASGVLVERFEPIETLSLIQEHRATVLFGAPPMFVAWVSMPGADQYDLSSVRLAISGAAALSEETLVDFESIFGVQIFEGYGLTESSPTVTTNRMAEIARPRSIGMPLPGVEVRLVDEDMNDVELGDPGELLVRGPNVFKGYWDRPDETERAFVDGWLRTGDVAVRDEEGYLYLVDRKRDLIIVSGFNVFPSEVEEVLIGHDRVAEAAVIGEPHPYTGEAVKAFVVLENGATLTAEELTDYAASRLARFKCPASVEIVDGLPQLLTGKVLRRALRT